MKNKMIYYWAQGKVVARSYKKWFDKGSRFETKDSITGLHHFYVNASYTLTDISRELANHIQDLIEEYGTITVTVEDYKNV